MLHVLTRLMNTNDAGTKKCSEDSRTIPEGRGRIRAQERRPSYDSGRDGSGKDCSGKERGTIQGILSNIVTLVDR